MGTLHVPNTKDGVRDAVIWAQREQAALRIDIRILRERLRDDWNRKFAELRTMLDVD